MIPDKWINIFNSDPIFLITGHFTKISTLKNKLNRSLTYRKKVLVLRISNNYIDVDKAVNIATKFCKKNNIPLILNTPNKFDFNADGYHLRAKELESKDIPISKKIIGASCHNREELLMAKKLGCDYAFLSPVISKGDSKVLGWNKFLKLKNEFLSLKIIPLGGINESNSMHNSYAGISHWWDHQNP